MPSKSQTTTKPSVVTSFATGQARSSHAGFSQTSTELPDSETIWSEYFNNVMRGSTDIDGTAVDASKTFSEASSTGEAPPTISNTTIDTVPVGGAAGEPAGGFVPTVGSARDGDAATIPASSTTFISGMSTIGHGTGRNGSVENPKVSSDKQPTYVANSISPSYVLGEYSS